LSVVCVCVCVCVCVFEVSMTMRDLSDVRMPPLTNQSIISTSFIPYVHTLMRIIHTLAKNGYAFWDAARVFFDCPQKQYRRVLVIPLIHSERENRQTIPR
jgi:hypothetical protein